MTTRQNFIGGSDVAAILGVNKYKTPHEIWDEKKNGNKTFFGNNFTDWGSRFEPVVIKYFEEKNGVSVVDNNRLFVSEIDFLACHPDGLFLNNGEYWLLEVKTVSSGALKGWGNSIPTEYFCQIQHNMFCTGTRKAKFVYLILDSREYNEMDVYFDQDYVNKQNEYLVQWWEKYIKGDEVPIKTLVDYEKTSPDIRTKEATNEVIELCKKANDLKQKIKELTEEKENIDNQIKLAIGDATDLVSGGKVLATWRPQIRVIVDTLRLKDKYSDVYKSCLKESISRTFLLK